ncbi:MAG: ion transporter [Muribaculaceae bacterium]|nr:ion transporter [Muribaculaceae bacterium]
MSDKKPQHLIDGQIPGASTYKSVASTLCKHRWFEFGITIVIIINSLLIGVETYHTSSTISIIQNIILYVFSLEILLRFLAAPSVKEFFKDGWNIFDLSLVIIGYIPESMFENASAMMALRVLRVFRVLRLLRAASEIKVIINVLLKSTTAMFYNVVLFGIFIYLFAIIGVGLFKLPDPEKLEGKEKENYEQLMTVAPHSPSNSPDPFGTLGEAMFTLFRELTGEDWTDLRYNHITAYELGVIKTPPAVTNFYHIIWFVISAFLLLNLVTGAIINNYQTVMEKSEHQKDENKKE